MSIIIKVFQNDIAKSKDSRLYERLIDWSEDIQFPFSSMLSSLKLLYPNSLIQFEVR